MILGFFEATPNITLAKAILLRPALVSFLLAAAGGALASDVKSRMGRPKPARSSSLWDAPGSIVGVLVGVEAIFWPSTLCNYMI